MQPNPTKQRYETIGALNGNLDQKNAWATGWHMIIGYAAKKRAICSSYQYPGYFNTLRKGIKQRKDAQVHARIGPLKTETLLKIDSNFVSPKQLTMRLCNSKLIHTQVTQIKIWHSIGKCLWNSFSLFFWGDTHLAETLSYCGDKIFKLSHCGFKVHPNLRSEKFRNS